MATQPVLQGVTLPWPRNPGGFAQRSGQRAVSIEVANGNLVFQRISTATRHAWTVSWTVLTTAQYMAIQGAYDDLLVDPFADNFTSVTGTTYTVTPETDAPAIEAVYTGTPDGGGSWDVTLRLREISNA